MSLQAMETLASVEQRLRQQRSDAQAAAKQALADAREKGEGLVAEAVRKAGGEVSALIGRTEEAAKQDARELADKSRSERDALRAKAKKREEEAVSFVVERIVNG